MLALSSGAADSAARRASACGPAAMPTGSASGGRLLKASARMRRQDDREDEHPEDGLGLANQFADARDGQLDERTANRVRIAALIHHAASVPSAT